MSRRLLLLASALLASCQGAAPSAKQEQKPEPLTVAMMPKNKGNPYFVSCRKGAEEAA